MRTARVLTNETCNQGCAFCTARKPSERRALVHPSSVRARVEQARAQGAEEIVLTGGEPTLRRDLAAIVSTAKGLGADVGLETNAVLVDEARARELAAAGLTRAYVHLPGWGEAYERVTRDPGSFELALRGARALAAAGVALRARVPVVRANLDALAELPRRVHDAGLALEALEFVVPNESPDPDALAPIESALRSLEGALEAARSVGVTARVAPGERLPPCVFPRPERIAHAYALTRGGADEPRHSRVAACAACRANDRCAGLPEAALARAPWLAERAKPIDSDRLRRRLTVITSPEAQAARELLTEETYASPDGSVERAGVVRVHFHCNQACDFCFVSTHLPPPPEASVRAAIERASELGTVVLSGGEPSLNPRLVEYVALARALGARAIELQSNAIRFASEPQLAARLREAGLDRAMISLHGSHAALSDAVTAAPGTFEKTLRGIDALVDAGVKVRLNHVACGLNAGDFPAFVRFVAERFPGVGVTVSFVGTHTDVVPRTTEMLPPLRVVGPALSAGITAARVLGVALDGFESMCGIPPCALTPEARALVPLGAEAMPTRDGSDGGEFVKPPACARCAYDHRCYGLRRGYVELHGDGDARAIAAPAAGEHFSSDRGIERT